MLLVIKILFCYSLQQDTFHPDKKPVAVKVMNIDYSRLGAQVLYVNFNMNIVYVAVNFCFSFVLNKHT